MHFSIQEIKIHVTWIYLIDLVKHQKESIQHHCHTLLIVQNRPPRQGLSLARPIYPALGPSHAWPRLLAFLLLWTSTLRKLSIFTFISFARECTCSSGNQISSESVMREPNKICRAMLVNAYPAMNGL